MGFLGTLWNAAKSVGGSIADAATGGLASAAGDALGGLFKKATGTDTVSQQKAIMQQQQQMEQENAMWNFQNIYQPTAEMENAEWDRRFQAQNSEWERQFNMQNEYNTPAAQIQRMRDAGINPAGMQAAPSANEAAQGMVGNPSVNEYASGGARAADAASAYQAASSDQLNIARARQIEMENQERSRDITKKDIENKYYESYMTGVLNLQNADIVLKGSERNLNRAKAKEVKANMEYAAAKTAETYTNMQKTLQDISESIARTNDLMEQTKGHRINNDWLEETREARTKKIFSEIYKDYATASEAHAAAKYYNEVAEEAMKRGSLLDIDIEIGRATKGLRITGAYRDYNLDEARAKIEERKLKIENKALDWSDNDFTRGWNATFDHIDRITGTIGNVIGGNFNFVESHSRGTYQSTSRNYNQSSNTNTNHNYSHGSPSYR